MLQVFEDKGFKVRVLGDSENPLFVAKDICDALGIANTRDAIASLKVKKEGVVSTDTLETNGGKQQVNVVTEQGLYLLIMQSKKKEAVEFQLWVTGEVLPQIRKTGSYKKNLTPAEILLEQAKQMVEVERRLKEQEATSRRLENNIRRTLTDVEYFTVIGYANLKGIKAGTYNSAVIGKRAKKLSKEKGYTTGSVVDPKYGNIGTYHIDILGEVFGV